MPWPLAAYALVIAAARAKLGRKIVRPPDRARGSPRRRADGRDRDQPASGQAAFGTQPKQQPGSADHAGAKERGRGRKAVSPLQIPWRGWKDILWRTYEEIGNDRLLAIAAGVVFYGLLALFPTITAFVSLYGLFADWSTIDAHIATASGFLPGGALDIFQEQVKRIVSQGEATLGFAFLFGLGLALWSANAGMKAIIDALNVIYDETEQRGFIKLTLVSLALPGSAYLYQGQELGLPEAVVPAGEMEDPAYARCGMSPDGWRRPSPPSKGSASPRVPSTSPSTETT